MLQPHYDSGIVALSGLVAVYAAYVALDLARRVHTRDRWTSLCWSTCGALVLGSGIWSMHFTGMLAMSLPIPLGYDPLHTALSWVAAVVASTVALRAAARDHLTRTGLATGSLAVGTAICAMHYIGMGALIMAPPIVWNPWLVAASAAIALTASGVALALFFAMRRLSGTRARLLQVLAALVMGLAIAGMHYTGMAAATFPTDTVCLSTNGIGGQYLTRIVVFAALTLLSFTLLTSVLDARLREHAAHLASSLDVAHMELKDANAELQRIAFHDALTGLPNRALLSERLKRALERVERRRRHASACRTFRLALLFIDLDGFKPVNDSYGHASGDSVLLDFADRLAAIAGPGDTPARVGGDEFVLLIEDLGEPDDALRIAERVVEAASKPFSLPMRSVTLSCSVGVVIHPDDPVSGRLMNAADAAMYTAKQAGGGRYALYEPHMQTEATDQLELQQDLRAAVERGELRVDYQPEIEARSGKLHGFEALLRWQHPTRGTVSPTLFVPLAERFGLMDSIGDWLINAVCCQLASWQALGLRYPVAINLSANQLRQPDLARRIGEHLSRYHVDSALLHCEITESVAMEDVLRTQRAVGELSALGVKLSIDDFGTGYSSLAYLLRLRVHQLKIDRSFVQDLTRSGDARTIVATVIQLAHSLGLEVVGEGVETSAQQDALTELGCDYLQGFRVARPMPASALSPVLDADGRLRPSLGMALFEATRIAG